MDVILYKQLKPQGNHQTKFGMYKAQAETKLHS